MSTPIRVYVVELITPTDAKNDIEGKSEVLMVTEDQEDAEQVARTYRSFLGDEGGPYPTVTKGVCLYRPTPIRSSTGDATTTRGQQ